MLQKNKKRRSAGEDKSCPQNSNQKSSTVEVGEMVTMDHGGTSGGLKDDCQRADYLQVAWLLREKLNDLVDGDEGEFPGLGLRSLLDMAASRNIVSVDPKMLNPVLWRTLPKELLLLVLARLPLPDITRLRCLSREWRRDMATVNSEINQACHEASPTMVALLSHTSTEAFFVTIYDITKCRWQYAYHLRLPITSVWYSDDLERWHHTWTAVDTCDDGLVCFISLWKPTKRNRLCIVVVNLLTRVQHQLPPLHYLYFALPAMVQLKVDFDTKCYKVVVAGYRRGSLTIEIYDSGTRQWTRTTPPCGSIFGPVHNWTSVNVHNGWYHRLSATLGAYDFAEGKLELYSKNNPSIGGSVIDSVLEKDRMFVLQEQMQTDASHRGMVDQGLCITEYNVENQTKDWVQGKSYECPFLEELMVDSLFGTSLTACDGFLMVTGGARSPYSWLLDLSTCEWSKLPETSMELHTRASVRKFPKTSKKLLHTRTSVLCRAFWNVVP